MYGNKDNFILNYAELNDFHWPYSAVWQTYWWNVHELCEKWVIELKNNNLYSVKLNTSVSGGTVRLCWVIIYYMHGFSFFDLSDDIYKPLLLKANMVMCEL
jgi:hypothetical protein